MMLPLYVARPILPDLHLLTEILGKVWERRTLTNEGPLHNQLETVLSTYLGSPNSKLFCNGTVALQCAILALDLPVGSEVITTPFTFAATAHAITACGLKVVFADVDNETLTLDPDSVELAITSRTKAVIGVHVYGNICDDARLSDLCNRHNLALIYDAAHAFGSKVNEKSVSSLGDMTMFSFHATKLFHTVEGGLVCSKDSRLANRLKLVRNFGILDEQTVSCVGINGKMSEINAAIGLLNIEILEEEIRSRSALRSQYDRIFKNFLGISTQPEQSFVTERSQQYYAIRVSSDKFGATRDEIYDLLKTKNIYSRKYFFPVCTDFDCYQGLDIVSVKEKSVVSNIKDEVLCMPFHSGVNEKHLEIIAETLSHLYKN